MKNAEIFSTRFKELDEQGERIPILQNKFGHNYIDQERFNEWSTRALNLLEQALSKNSIHYLQLKKIFDDCKFEVSDLKKARGVFKAAKADFDSGYLIAYEQSITGEILG